MNENDTPSSISPDPAPTQPGALRTIVTDDGVQRALAGVAVALVVSGAKFLIFGRN